jgi:HEAT repeat protein
VECLDCIPLLEGKLLNSNDPKVREMAAWWLRRRVFGYGRAAVAMRGTLMTDTDPVRRARAAEALGEFLDVRGLPALQNAVTGDDSVDVRHAAVRALGRLNAQSGDEVLAMAFEDEAASVRRAALDQVPRMNFFKQQTAVLGLLQDADAAVRLRAAQVVGELRIADADDALIDLLQDDPKAVVRQASAWALGRSGSSAAQKAVRDALPQEKDPGVLDALDVALRMKR